MIRHIFIFNLTSMSALPAAERWYWRNHAPQSVRKGSPWMTRYESYRAVPPPEGAEAFGYYNYRETEIWYRELEPMGNYRDLIFYPDYFKDFGIPDPEEHYATRWLGQKGGPYPPVQLYAPALPTNDFKGRGTPPDEHTILRWFIAFKYPEGVPIDEAEDWYVKVHAPEAKQQQGLTRFFSTRGLELPEKWIRAVSPKHPHQYPWHRVSEMWYENYDTWRDSVIDNPPAYTPPPWAPKGKYPFFEPYRDFVSTFLLERPDWTLADIRPFP